MNGLFTYTIELRDRLTAAMNKAGGSVNSTIRRVQSLRREVSDLNKQRLDGLRNSIKGAFNNIPFSQYIFNPLTVAGVVGGRALQLGIENEMRNASFEVLFGGEEKAKKMIDAVSDYASRSTYGKDAISGAAQMMAGFGIAQERIIPNIKAIGEIAMGNKPKFDSLTLAFSQMSATGSLMGQDLNQMINAGFNPLLQMSKDTGKSIATLKDEMGKGLISSDMVAASFRNATKEGGQFYGMSEKMSATLGGQLNKTMSNINDKLLALYDIMQPYIMPALSAFNLLLTDSDAFLGKLAQKVNNLSIWAKIFGGVVLWLVGTLVAYKTIMGVITLVTKGWAAAQAILNLIMSMNPLVLIIAGVVALIALIAFLIIKIDGWGEAWKHTVNGAKLIFKILVDSVKLYFNTMLNGIMIGLNKIKTDWYKFKDAIGAGDSSENKRMLAEIQADTDARKKAIADGAKDLIKTSKEVANEFKLAGSSLKFNDTSLSDVTKGLKSKIGIDDPTTDATANGGNATKNGKAGKTASSIATGGSKTTHITINLGNLVHTINLTSGEVKDGAAKIRDVVLDELSRALTMAQANV